MAHKPKRGAPTIDMTAMVDVAFLLLTFFILTTTKFREDQSAEVDTPSSVSSLTPPDKGLMTISVDNEGRIFAGFSDISTRESAIQRMISDEFITGEVSEEGYKHFISLEDFGVTLDKGEFVNWLNTPKSEREEYIQEGMTAVARDTLTGAGNDLKLWIRAGRLADQRMRFAIKGDVDASYEEIGDVISTLQDWNINQFSLITELEEGPSAVEVEE
ncbi:MAG: biopolymer transporter ExbD [Bacteroidota bacterium]